MSDLNEKEIKVDEGVIDESPVVDSVSEESVSENTVVSGKKRFEKRKKNDS